MSLVTQYFCPLMSVKMICMKWIKCLMSDVSNGLMWDLCGSKSTYYLIPQISPVTSLM